MGRKGINKGHKEKWSVNHIRIVNYLRDKGLREKRGKSEMAKDLGIARSTLNAHLEKVSQDKLYLKYVGKEQRLFLQRDYKEVFAEALMVNAETLFESGKALYSFLNIPEGREIGTFCVASDIEENVQKIMSIFSYLQTLFFNIDPFLLSHIFRYALRKQLIHESYFNGEKDLSEISDEELERLWCALFGDSKKAMITFSINPQKLLEWIKEEGKNDLRRALPKEVCREIYRETSKLRKQREEWDKRLKPLEISS